MTYQDLEEEYNYELKRNLELISKLDELQNKTCGWTKNDEYEDGNVWHTDCKLDWCIPDDDTPKDHYMKYCPKCGGKIVIKEG